MRNNDERVLLSRYAGVGHPLGWLPLVNGQHRYAIGWIAEFGTRNFFGVAVGVSPDDAEVNRRLVMFEARSIDVERCYPTSCRAQIY